MKIKKEIENMLNEQLKIEIESSYLYLSMSAFFESQNLKGFARWMLMQSKEEWEHAMKIYNYIFERGGKVSLPAIDSPKKEWESPLDAFEDAYKHELEVTENIHKISNSAASENDLATVEFLKWFIEEQVEEEAQADDVVQKLKLIKNAPGGLYMLDRELGARNK